MRGQDSEFKEMMLNTHILLSSSIIRFSLSFVRASALHHASTSIILIHAHDCVALFLLHRLLRLIDMMAMAECVCVSLPCDELCLAFVA